MKAIDRKQIAQFVPSVGPTARACEPFGIKFSDIQSVLDTISTGLRWPAVNSFLNDSGFTRAEVADYLGWPPRTLERRIEAGRLNEHESERMFRLAEIYEHALHLFNGDKTDAREWLLSPVHGLNNKRPIDYARIDYGAREVRNLIGRLEHGVFS